MSDDLVEAIHDLTRVTIALHGGFASKSEAVRRLYELSIPTSRIAAILAMPSADVRSAISKAKHLGKGTGRKSGGADDADGEEGRDNGQR